MRGCKCMICLAVMNRVHVLVVEVNVAIIIKYFYSLSSGINIFAEQEEHSSPRRLVK